MSQYNEYPKWLHHPHEQPAIISDDWERGPPSVGHQAPVGRPRSFPPVLVHNRDQEEYHIARGYVAGESQREAAIRAPLPNGYQYREFPRVVNGTVQGDPTALPPDDGEYPKWLYPEGRDPVLVKSRAEEDAVLPPPPPSEAEAECLAAILAAAGDAETPDDLVAQAADLGIRVDRRWGKSRLQTEIDKALAA